MRLEHGALHGEADDHDHFTDVSPDVLKVQPELHRYVFQTRDIEVKPYTYSPEETPEHLQALQIPRHGGKRQNGRVLERVSVRLPPPGLPHTSLPQPTSSLPAALHAALI